MKIGVDYYPEHWDKALWRADADLILFPIKNAPNPLPTSNTDDCIF